MTKINHGAAIRKWETSALKDGVITSSEAADLAQYTGKKGSASDKALIKDLLSRDAFDPAARASAIWKAAGLAKSEQARSPVLGKEVGTGVFVQKSFSPVEGYASPYRALAAARLSGATHVAAVPDANNRWHAVELTKGLGSAAAMNGAIALDTATSEADLKALYTQATRAETKEEKVALFQELASKLYGVAPSAVNVMMSDGKAIAGMINVDVTANSLPATAAGQVTSACGCKDHSAFQVDSPYAVTIRADTLAEPRKAAETLFHELTHADDYGKAQTLMKAYAKDQPSAAKAFNAVDFSRRYADDLDPNDKKAMNAAITRFQTWVNDPENKATKGLSQEDKDTLRGYVTNETGATEAKAYTQTWMQGFRAQVSRGADTTALAGELLTWADGQTKSKVPLSQAGMKQINKELTAFFKTLTQDEQTKFLAAIAYAQKQNPNSLNRVNDLKIG